MIGRRSFANQLKSENKVELNNKEAYHVDTPLYLYPLSCTDDTEGETERAYY